MAREANGKTSRRDCNFYLRSRKVIIYCLSIEDDGAGMDADHLRGIAVNKGGLMDADAADRLSDEEAFNLIFAPWFFYKK